MNVKRWQVVACAAFALVGCGGGGGGDGASGGGTSAPVDPNAATFQFSARYPELTTWTMWPIEALENGNRLLTYAQFATDIAHRFAVAGSPATVTANCAYTGRITLQFTDRDGNGRASTGDTITAVLDKCGVPTLSRAVSGTLRVDILASSPTADVQVQTRFTVVDALTIAALGGGPNIGVTQPGVLRGSLGAEWSESATGSQLRAVSTTEDDLRFTASYDGIESTDSLRKIDVSRTTRYDTAAISSSMAFLFDVGSRGGMLRVRTVQPFRGDLNVAPKQFRVDVEIAGGRALRAERTVSSTDASLFGLSTVEATGSIARSTAGGWGGFLALMKDARQVNGPSNYTDQGSGYRTLQPWRGSPFLLDIDLACKQEVVAGINRFRADALFQVPVAAQPGLAEANAVIKLQFGRAIADSSGQLQFRLADAAEIVDAGSPTWSVATTTARRGAYYEIRPAEPLRQGRQYYLQSSYDGVNWTGDRVILDAQNQIVNQGQSNFANVSTDNVLVAETGTSDLGVVSAVSPARLRSTVNLRDGQAVTSYQWQQLSGVPLRLSTPQAAESDVVLAASSAQAVGDALMQLTVTDSLGNSDRVRVAMKAGNFVSQGAVFYTEAGVGATSSRRALSIGAGSVFYGPAAGAVSPRVPGSLEGGTGVNFSVVPANGQQLVVGTYPNAVMSTMPGAQNGLVSRVYCNTAGSPVTGSFEVSEVAYAADGTIARLAVDYVQQCVAGLGEFQRGSYRYDSAVTLRP